jgi:hypothetical protein
MGGGERDERVAEETGEENGASNEPPVDGPGAAEGNDEAGATSYDEPGGEEHGT